LQETEFSLESTKLQQSKRWLYDQIKDVCDRDVMSNYVVQDSINLPKTPIKLDSAKVHPTVMVPRDGSVYEYHRFPIELFEKTGDEIYSSSVVEHHTHDRFATPLTGSTLSMIQLKFGVLGETKVPPECYFFRSQTQETKIKRFYQKGNAIITDADRTGGEVKYGSPEDVADGYIIDTVQIPVTETFKYNEKCFQDAVVYLSFQVMELDYPKDKTHFMSASLFQELYVLSHLSMYYSKHIQQMTTYQILETHAIL